MTIGDATTLIQQAEQEVNNLLREFDSDARTLADAAAASKDPGAEQQARAVISGMSAKYAKEAAALQRFQIGGQRRAIHRQQLRDAADGRRFGAVQRHQERELAARQADRLQCQIVAPRQCSRRALRTQTEAGVTHPVGDLERQRL